MTYPEKFGSPCWEKQQVEKCIQTVAQVQQEKADFFLASHSPIQNIRDVKANTFRSEEQTFKRLFSKAGEVRAVVRGGPGTGKSHLIRWINLRAESAVKAGELDLEKFKMVLVERDTGSVKSALSQIVKQLGKEFSKYVSELSNSIENFSNETAEEALINEMALELSQRRKQRGYKPLDEDIQSLGTLIQSPGYKTWLRRDGGVISRTITRLTEASTVEEREQSIQFEAGEVAPLDLELNERWDAPEVFKFVSQVEHDDIEPELVAKALNQALVDARKELTGIRGSKLQDIFSAIRRELQLQGKQLVVFIEDVTAASGGLDVELFQAFEPKQDSKMCRMIAVLGMTNEGWNPLPGNEKNRVTFEWDVEASASKWSSDQEKIAEFTARYLNAVRYSDDEISEVAHHRFGSDVNISKCDMCPHQSKCHQSFGVVELSRGTFVGMFPFSKRAPYSLLRNLGKNKEDVKESPRGLLDHVLEPALFNSFEDLEENAFPDSENFDVGGPAPKFWTSFVNKFLGGTKWKSDELRNRFQFLAEHWVDVNNADDCSLKLNLFREPLGFPYYSAEVPDEPVDPLGPVGPTDPDPPPPPPPPPLDGLDKALTELFDWKRGKDLINDSKYRSAVLDLVQKSVDWPNQRELPIKLRRDLFKNSAAIRIEGQRSKSAITNFFFDLKRNDESFGLLEALIRYQLEGRKSWGFSDAEIHKRRVVRWLRKNEHSIINAMKPNPVNLETLAITTAIQVSALHWIVKNNEALPKRDHVKRVDLVFESTWPELESPKALSEKLQKIFTGLGQSHARINNFLVTELGVGQGDADPKDFINPMKILEALKSMEKNIGIDPLPESLSQGFWRDRFDSVGKLGWLEKLHESLLDEKIQADQIAEEFEDFLKAFKYPGENLGEELKQICQEIQKTAEAINTNFPNPDVRFDPLWRSKDFVLKRFKWGNALAQIDGLESLDLTSLVSLDSESLKEAKEALVNTTQSYLLGVEHQIRNQEKVFEDEIVGGTKEKFIEQLEKMKEVTVQKND